LASAWIAVMLIILLSSQNSLCPFF